MLYEDAYGESNLNLMTAQEIKDKYEIEIEDTSVISSTNPNVEDFPPKARAAFWRTETIFSAEVYYDDGFAKKIQPLPQVIASNPEEAQLLAEKKADELVGEGNWLEANVRPIGLASEHMAKEDIPIPQPPQLQ